VLRQARRGARSRYDRRHAERARALRPGVADVQPAHLADYQFWDLSQLAEEEPAGRDRELLVHALVGRPELFDRNLIG
jgi:hypothetical protein